MKRENLKINEPCTEDWDAMSESDGSARFCDKCTKNVHNLSDMTREEASEFLASQKDSSLCVIYKFDSKTQEVLFRKARPSSGQLAGLKRLLAAAAMVPMLAGCDTSHEMESCAVGQEVRPIDLIREQESRFMDFFSDFFDAPPERMVGTNAPVEVMGEPAIHVPPEPQVDVRPVEHTDETQPIDHVLREELDGETKPPIRRLMGSIAPTRVPEPEPPSRPEPEHEEVMGLIPVDF